MPMWDLGRQNEAGEWGWAGKRRTAFPDFRDLMAAGSVNVEILLFQRGFSTPAGMGTPALPWASLANPSGQGFLPKSSPKLPWHNPGQAPLVLSLVPWEQSLTEGKFHLM